MEADQDKKFSLAINFFEVLIGDLDKIEVMMEFLAAMCSDIE